MVLSTWLISFRKQLVHYGVISRAPRKARRSGVIGRTRKVDASESLEARCLLSAVYDTGVDLDSDHDHESVHSVDDHDHDHDHDLVIHVDEFGNEWCEMPEFEDLDHDPDHHEGDLDHDEDDHFAEAEEEEARTIAGGTTGGGASPFPLAETFYLNTNPGARHTIYLDFNGHTTAGTSWNSSFTGGAPFVTPEYNTDGTAGFSNTELANIQKIWQRVAEDFITFDVNVTTQEPADINDLLKSSSSDTRWGVRVAIGGSSYDWYGAGAGGVAYLTSFNWNSDTPTYAFTAQLGNGNVKYTAEAVSHEVGHTLGLRHDGTSSTGYYGGHGSGETGWAPIMGVGYYQNLSQWSFGEYAGANNRENDLGMITTQNGFGYRSDDYGNTVGTATPAFVVNPTTIDGAGLIEQSTDVDVFSFVTAAGNISLTVSPFETGPNLDIRATLLNSAGTVITASNPTDALGATINQNVPAGTYYLSVAAVGKGDPLTTGYSSYGSIGQYSFLGSIIAPGVVPDLTISDATVIEGGNLVFTLSLSEAVSNSVSVDFATANGTAVAGSDYTAQNGTITFNPGETSKTVTISTVADVLYEGNETLSLNLSNASGLNIADGSGAGTIVDDDPMPLPSIRITDANAIEGNLIMFGADAGKPEQTLMTFRVSLSAASSSTVTVQFGTVNGTATTGNRDYTANSGVVTFSPGQISKTIQVVILGDLVVEDDETFRVVLTNPSNATIDDGSGTGLIINDDRGIPRSPGGGTGGRVDIFLGFGTGAVVDEDDSSNGTVNRTDDMDPRWSKRSTLITSRGENCVAQMSQTETNRSGSSLKTNPAFPKRRLEILPQFRESSEAIFVESNPSVAPATETGLDEVFSDQVDHLLK
ncbi:MAG: hypothetical protein JNL58_14365 [Planctomyces sp.]|nr:hypothetical protein [Planctomyces sp.]